VTRVSHSELTPSETGVGFERWRLVPPERGSELALDAIDLRPDAQLELTDPLHDGLLLVHEGEGAVVVDGVRTEIAAVASLVVPAGAVGTLHAGPAGLSTVHATIGATVDLHAPMGRTETLVSLDSVEPGTATGARSFQLLHGPHNGSVRATGFVGYIPPGAAPWHYHLYDEIVWILRGKGRLHVGDDVEALAPGSAFRLHPREVHIVENVQPLAELAVLGIFTPAGSPSAAYLEPGVAATYTVADSKA
jgi:quercetin dioxygenase-like cupin family protein